LQELPAVIGVSAGPSPREDPATRAGPPRAVPTTTRPSPLAPRPLAALAPVPPATRATRPAPPSVASGPTAPPSTGIRSPSVGPATAPTWAPRPVVSLPAGLPAVRPLPPIPAPSVAPAESGRGLDDRTVPASDLDPFHEPVHPRRVTAPPLEPGPVEVGRIRRRTYVLAGVRAVGIALVCFVLYALYGTALLEGHAQRHLDPSTHLRLSSVNIGLDELVLGSDSAGNLRKGPGLAAGSGLPGSAAPIVIMGHRTAAGGPFRHLSALRPGASIVLRSPGGPTYTYVVDGLVTTTPRAVIRPSPGAQVLYLVTAAPAYQDGRRLVVVARSLTGPRANPVSQAYRLPGLGGSPASAVEAVLLLGLLGAGWVARSRWRLDLPRWVVWGAWVPALLVTYAASVLLLGGMSRLL